MAKWTTEAARKRILEILRSEDGPVITSVFKDRMPSCSKNIIAGALRTLLNREEIIVFSHENPTKYRYAINPASQYANVLRNMWHVNKATTEDRTHFLKRYVR